MTSAGTSDRLYRCASSKGNRRLATQRRGPVFRAAIGCDCCPVRTRSDHFHARQSVQALRQDRSAFASGVSASHSTRIQGSTSRTRAATGSLLSIRVLDESENRPPGRGQEGIRSQTKKRTARKNTVKEPTPGKGKIAKNTVAIGSLPSERVSEALAVWPHQTE